LKLLATKAPRCVFLLGASLAAAAQGQSSDEYRVKAVFLYNFAKFVEWPPETFRKSTDPITICTLGYDPYRRALEETVHEKTIRSRTFLVRQVSDVEQANTCQILFVSASERKRAAAILPGLKATGVLTVGETEGFAAEGGVINFKMEDGRVRLEVNVAAAERAKLRISSKLLSLVQIVKK
jgi:hypothetical protein